MYYVRTLDQLQPYVVCCTQAQMDQKKAVLDDCRTYSEVEREIDNFEQNKLRDIKVLELRISCFVTNRL